MKTRLESVPCLVRQALDAVRMATDDEAVQETVIRQVLRDMSAVDLDESAPAMVVLRRPDYGADRAVS